MIQWAAKGVLKGVENRTAAESRYLPFRAAFVSYMRKSHTRPENGTWGEIGGMAAAFWMLSHSGAGLFRGLAEMVGAEPGYLPFLAS